VSLSRENQTVAVVVSGTIVRKRLGWVYLDCVHVTKTLKYEAALRLPKPFDGATP
jgi:hypothetical protein